jgi:homoserine dehydrogenase
MATQTIPLSHSPLRETVRDSRKVAILGFGTVGSSVARILNDGRLEGLELTQVFNRNIERKRASWLGPAVRWTQSFDDVLSSDAEVVVEVMGGVEPARSFVVAALESGRSVVTANKQLIARCGPELSQVATKHGCQLLFGASVAGGVPVIAAIEKGLAGDELQSICGILNGTCNYILSQMEQGQPFSSALAKAQELGYAEADPTDDIAGYDTRAKLVILARAALGAELCIDTISCSPISDVAPVDFEYARELDCTIRQVGEAYASGSSSFATVEPMLVRKDSPLARARGCENVVITTGKFGGRSAFSGPGAGGDATAVAVVSDLMALSHPETGSSKYKCRRLDFVEDRVAPYFLRFVVTDRPGIVASIAAILANFDINVDAVFQRPGHDKSKLPFVVTIEACSGANLNAALAEISRKDFLVEPPLKLRIFES